MHLARDATKTLYFSTLRAVNVYIFGCKNYVRLFGWNRLRYRSTRVIYSRRYTTSLDYGAVCAAWSDKGGNGFKNYKARKNSHNKSRFCKFQERTKKATKNFRMEKTAGGFDLPYRPPVIAALESTIVILFLILSVFGNTLIIAAFFHLKSLRTIPNILVVNLSFVDFLSAITTHPLLASVLIRGAWYLGQEACKYQAIFNSFLFTTKNLSITFITLNRYLIIVRYKKMFTKRSTRLCLVAIWISSCLLALSPLMGEDEAIFHAEEALCVFSSKNSAISVVIVVFENIVFLATTYLNYAILSLVRLHRKKVFSALFNKNTSRVTPESAARVNCPSNAIGTRGTIANRNEEPHIARKVFTVTTLYSICWLPQGLLKIASLTNSNISREIWMTSTFCMQLSSVLNPFLYGLLNTKLRKTIFGMFRIKAKQLIQVAATDVSTRRLQMRTFKGAFTVSRAGV